MREIMSDINTGVETRQPGQIKEPGAKLTIQGPPGDAGGGPNPPNTETAPTPEPGNNGSYFERNFEIPLRRYEEMDLTNPERRATYEALRQARAEFFRENQNTPLFRMFRARLEAIWKAIDQISQTDPYSPEIQQLLTRARVQDLEEEYWQTPGAEQATPRQRFGGSGRAYFENGLRSISREVAKRCGFDVPQEDAIEGEWSIEGTKSEFERLQERYESARRNYIRYRSLNRVASDPDREIPADVDRTKLDDLLRDARTEVQAIKQEIGDFINDAGGLEILTGVMVKLADDYRELRMNHPRSDREDILVGAVDPRYGGRLFRQRDWEANMWNDSSFVGLRNRYKGLPNFIYHGLMDAITRDSRREASPDNIRKRMVDKLFEEFVIDPDALIEDDRFVNLKVDRELHRLADLKAELDQFYRPIFRIEDENDFLILVPKRIRYVEKKTSDEAVAQQYQAIERGRQEIAELVFNALDRFNHDFNLDLEPDEPAVRRMITLTETRMNAFGGARTVNRGGFEHYIHFRENDANNYVAHVEAMYIEDPNMPPVLHFMSHGLEYDSTGNLNINYNNFGEYWRGCPPEVVRPDEQDIILLQEKEQGRYVEYISTHELILKARVDKRIHQERRELVLMTRDDRKDREEEIFFEERDRFFKEHPVFIRTRERNDKLDAEQADEMVKKGKITPEVANLLKRLGGNLTENQRREVTWQIIDLKMRQTDFLVQEELTNPTREKLDLVGTGILDNSANGKALKAMLIRQIKYQEGLDENERTKQIEALNQDAFNLNHDQIIYLKDKLYWSWVQRRNDIHDKDNWYPTSWDEIRYLIDRPEKVLRRAMSAQEMFDMYRPVDFSYLDYIYGREPTKEERAEAEKAERKRRIEEAVQTVDTAHTYLIFEGIASRDGGTRIEIYEDDKDKPIIDRATGRQKIDPETGEPMFEKKLVFNPVFGELWKLLDKVSRINFGRQDNPRPAFLPKDATDPEHAAIVEYDASGKPVTFDDRLFRWYQGEQEAYKKHSDLRQRYENMMKGKFRLSNGKYRKITDNERKAIERELRHLRDTEGACADILAIDGKRRWIFFEGKFVVRDLLKDLGVSGRLPIWSSYLVSSDIPLKEFSELLGVSPKAKQNIGMILERERRILADVTDQLVNAFMLKPYDENDPNPQSKMDSWNGVNVLALRDNWKGGNIDLRKIFNARWYFSTSGGSVAKGLIPIMDLGIGDMWQEISGAEDARKHVGFVFRRDEIEFRKVPLFDVLDPVDYNRRLAAAEELRKIIGGGKVGDRAVLGFLNAVLNGAFKMRVARSYNGDIFGGGIVGKNLDEFEWRYEDYDVISKHDTARIDKFMAEVGGDIIKPLVELMEGRKTLENRYTRASDQWMYDNTKIWYWFRNWLRYSPEVRRPPFSYANEARTELAIRIYEMFLQESGYILPAAKREESFPEEWAKNRVDRRFNHKQNRIYEEEQVIA